LHACDAAIRSAIVALAAACSLAANPAAAQPRRAEPPAAISVRAEAIGHFDPRDAGRRQFGLLEFRGGLVLTSPHKEFGGISALRVQPDGANFIAATDKGWWLKGRIAYDGTRATAIAGAEMAPMLGPDGTPLIARRWYDAESIAQHGGTLYVGLERVNQILRYDYGRDGLTARGKPIAVPPRLRTLPHNQGIEALVYVPAGLRLAGTLIAISERALDVKRNILAFLLGGPQPGTFSIRRRDDFDVSDAALLPSGDLLVLERKFSWTGGLGIRIRHILLAEVRPEAVVDGRALFEADLGYQIDNMEGLSVHKSATGDTVLTMISDDNFSPLQRTLLLQFTLAEP
jgi:hypothetical protein